MNMQAINPYPRHARSLRHPCHTVWTVYYKLKCTVHTVWTVYYKLKYASHTVWLASHAILKHKNSCTLRKSYMPLK
jgi:hypothetical protein